MWRPTIFVLLALLVAVSAAEEAPTSDFTILSTDMSTFTDAYSPQQIEIMQQFSCEAEYGPTPSTIDICGCGADRRCGVCYDTDDDKPISGCITIAGQPQGSNICSVLDPGNDDVKLVILGECKSGAAQYIGIVAFLATCIILSIIWWCVRGRLWWRSTKHERCCCHPEACCKGCCCCHPYEARPPPHKGLCHSKNSKLTRKLQAVRVSPLFPQNPCGICYGAKEDKWDKEAHPCGLGCACECNWIPGCCCFKWPNFLVKRCCYDELPRVPTELEQQAAAAVSGVKQTAANAKGKVMGIFGKGKKDNGNASAPQGNGAPPPQQGYPPPQQGGHPPPQQGYPPPQQGGAYPPQQGGAYPPPQGGGGAYPPPQQGGGAYPPPPQQGGGGGAYPPPQQAGGGYNNAYPPPQA